MNRIAVFPGTFDPFTKGHESIVHRAIPLFDKIIIAVGHNTAKKTYLSLESRKQIISEVFEGNDKIDVTHYEGLTVDFCKKNGRLLSPSGIKNSGRF
jgi:pantetheine-phosphate adenylyltransferase